MLHISARLDQALSLLTPQVPSLNDTAHRPLVALVHHEQIRPPGDQLSGQVQILAPKRDQGGSAHGRVAKVSKPAVPLAHSQRGFRFARHGVKELMVVECRLSYLWSNSGSGLSITARSRFRAWAPGKSRVLGKE